MKILWLTNIALPEANKLMNEPVSPFGGWLVNASAYLSTAGSINLDIAFPKTRIKKINFLSGEKIGYYAFPIISEKDISQGREVSSLIEVLEQVEPDIVHIYGTEYAHTLAAVSACKKLNIKAVISIQGLVSIIPNHYLVGIPCSVQCGFTFRDLIRFDNLRQQQKKFVKRGLMEVEAIQIIDHVIGRTTWDKACSLQINPGVQYHFCNEILREAFYNHVWDINQCEKHTIFVSQGSSPIKGLHHLLEAMPLILERFPDAKLYIAGSNPTCSDTWKTKIKRSSYGKYLKELISKNQLKNHIEFTGILDEKQMCSRYLGSHVFVCPSSIENSPNSLGEAMILGTPCVASFVGGIPDMIRNNVDGFLYQNDAPYMLAHHVCEIFANDELALEVSNNAREHALKTHDKDINTRRLMEIYKDIIGRELEQ